MKAILFAVLIFGTASASGITQRSSEESCGQFNCMIAETGVAAGEMVNRNGKSDRLPVAQPSHRLLAKQSLKIESHRIPLRDHEMVEGCESLASSLSHSSLANIAGRCLS
jgi:hypothetical protein